MLLALIFRLLEIYELILVVRAVVSWFSPNPYNQLYQILLNLTEPVLSRIRKITHKLLPASPFDFSVLIAILMIEGLRKLIIVIFYGF